MYQQIRNDSLVCIFLFSVLALADLCNPIKLVTNQSRAQSKKGRPVSSNKNDILFNSSIRIGGLRRNHDNSTETENIQSENDVENHDDDILALASFYDRPEYT